MKGIGGKSHPGEKGGFRSGEGKKDTTAGEKEKGNRGRSDGVKKIWWLELSLSG